MVTLQEVLRLLDQSKNEALLLAQSSLSQSQFEAYRKIFLNIFGKNGLEKELARLYAEDRKQDRNGQE
jgi:GTP-sensing pleiotropic transcriptional regulator CodY